MGAIHTSLVEFKRVFVRELTKEIEMGTATDFRRRNLGNKQLRERKSLTVPVSVAVSRWAKT